MNYSLQSFSNLELIIIMNMGFVYLLSFCWVKLVRFGSPLNICNKTIHTSPAPPYNKSKAYRVLQLVSVCRLGFLFFSSCEFADSLLPRC